MVYLWGMQIKQISIELSDTENAFIEGQKYMMQQIYTALQIPKSMLGLDTPIAKKKTITLNRNKTLKYLICLKNK